MTKKEYFKRLCEARASRLNVIIGAVNSKLKQQDAGLRDEFERMFFDNLVAEAKSHEEKYGFWPTFEMMEIDTDDPVLDIYSTSADKRIK